MGPVFLKKKIFWKLLISIAFTFLSRFLCGNNSRNKYFLTSTENACWINVVTLKFVRLTIVGHAGLNFCFIFLHYRDQTILFTVLLPYLASRFTTTESKIMTEKVFISYSVLYVPGHASAKYFFFASELRHYFGQKADTDFLTRLRRQMAPWKIHCFQYLVSNH